jgi:hypothetical protein
MHESKFTIGNIAIDPLSANMWKKLTGELNKPELYRLNWLKL